MQTLVSRLSMLRQRAVAIFHRSNAPSAETAERRAKSNAAIAETAERRAKWNAAIAEHKLGQQPKGQSAPDATRT